MNFKKIKQLNRARLDYQKRLKIVVTSFIFDFLMTKQEAFDPHVVKNILLLRVDGKIGDSIVASGLVKGLQGAGYSVDVLVGKSNAFIYQTPSFLGGIFTHAIKESNLFKTAWLLRRQRYDLLIDMGDNMSSAHYALVSLINAKYTLGFNKSTLKRYNVNIPYLFYERHISERYQALLLKLGVNTEKYSYEMHIPDINANEASQFTSSLPQGLRVVINPFASNKIRYLSEHQLKFIVDKIYQLNPESVVIIIGPPSLLNAFNADPRVIKSPFSSFYSAAAIIRQAALLITPDTSWVHVASIYQKPLIALYAKVIADGGFNSFKVWAPNYAQATQIITPDRSVASITNEEIGVEIERYMQTTLGLN